MNVRALRVLHADDDESFALLVRRSLQGASDLRELCELIQVSDGSEAVDYVLGRREFEARAAVPHLVLLDQRMRHVDGLDALRAIREKVPPEQMLACILTTSTQQELVEACYRVAGTFHVEKPATLQQLEPRLRAIIGFARDALRLPWRP